MLIDKQKNHSAAVFFPCVCYRAFTVTLLMWGPTTKSTRSVHISTKPSLWMQGITFTITMQEHQSFYENKMKSEGKSYCDFKFTK